MMHIVALLIIINFVLLIAIAMIRQANPFDLWVVFWLLLANAAVFMAVGIMTHNSPIHALSGLAANVLPVIFAGGGVILLLLVMAYLSHGKNSRT